MNSVVLQIVSVSFTVLATYIFFATLGHRGTSLFFDRSKKAAWDSNIRGSLGSWLIVCSFFGTLTSFATYIFLVGSVKLFGWFSIVTSVTVAVSYYVTNALTRPIMADPRVACLLGENQQVSGVIASLFWNKTSEGILTSRTIKWVSIVVICSLLWLECTAFVKFSFWIAGYDDGITILSALYRATIFFLVSFSIIYFVLKYGIRGFVFADLLHAPLIGLAALFLLAGALYITFFTSKLPSASLGDVIAPLPSPIDERTGIPYFQALVFAFHVLVLNLTQIVYSEHHWFRLWLIGRKEIEKQPLGAHATAFVWAIMLPIGFIAFLLAGQPGEHAIVSLLTELEELNPIFLLMFWVGDSCVIFDSRYTDIFVTTCRTFRSENWRAR